MALILHLTDLHLAKNQEVGDFKTQSSLQQEDKITRLTIYKETLKELKLFLISSKQNLDAIIVSGDITIQNDAEGFDLLEDVLNALGNKRPDNSKILVVPGNHDVTWKVLPSSREKYKNFLEKIRKKKYVTPFLDGVDKASARNKRGLFSIENENIQFVLINSSNYCGSQEVLTIKEDEYTLLKDLINNHEYGKKFIEYIEKLRTQDIARISPSQLTYLKSILNSELVKNKENVLKIAITHHHIDNVSTSEEFKSFESITNGGLLNNFLLENNFHILVHGHKHHGTIYWKWIPNYNRLFNDVNTQQPLLVISGATMSHSDSSKDEDVCRLFKIEKITTGHKIEISPIVGMIIGGNFNFPKETYSYNINTTTSSLNSLNPPSISTIISGNNLNDTYAKILDYFKTVGNEKNVYQIVTEIKEFKIEEVYKLPRLYVNNFGSVSGEEWLKNIVDWWSRSKTKLVQTVNFTHGQRIYNYNSKEIDQKSRVIKIIRKHIKERLSLSTARLIINLYSPEIDDLSKGDLDAPQFTLLQLLIEENLITGKLNLNCVAYFRKQEMRYWWAVNVSEIKKLVVQVIKEIGSSQLIPGSITIIAAVAYSSREKTLAEVAIPKIDRLFDDYKINFHKPGDIETQNNNLWLLIYSLLHKDVQNRDNYRMQWIDILENLIPLENRDINTVPISIDGIEYVVKQIELYLRVRKSHNLENYKHALISLLDKNKMFLRKEKGKDRDAIEYSYENWRSDCKTIVTEAKKHIIKVYS